LATIEQTDLRMDARLIDKLERPYRSVAALSNTAAHRFGLTNSDMTWISAPTIGPAPQGAAGFACRTHETRAYADL
jgi:hypothetical protein